MLRQRDRAAAAERPASAWGPTTRGAPLRRGALERFLRPFADVRAGEAPQLLLLALNMFLVLAAYYVMKPVREALILAQPGGAEIKSYAMAVQALLLIVAVPLYGALAARMARRRLIGIFSLMVIAQFWAYAADLYTPEAGKRLFALIAFGASSGAVAGALICTLLIRVIGVYPLLLVAAGILVGSVAVFNLVERRARRRGAVAQAASEADEPIGAGNPFAIVFQHRYLTLMALLMVVLNWTASTGEYIVGSVVTSTGEREIAAGQLRAEDLSAFIGHFYAGYFQAINVAGMALQLLVVSRVIAFLGVPVAVCILPLVALGCYGAAALAPVLGVIRVAKSAERAIDSSSSSACPPWATTSSP